MRDLGDFKRCRLLVLLSASTVALSLVGYLGKNTVYAENSVDLIKSPQLAVVFEGMEQGKYPWDILAFDSKQTAAAARKNRGSSGENTTAGGGAGSGDAASNGDTTGNEDITGNGDATGKGTSIGDGDATGKGTATGNGDATGKGAATGNGGTAGNGNTSGNEDTTGNGNTPGNGDNAGNGNTPSNGNTPGNGNTTASAGTTVSTDTTAGGNDKSAASQENGREAGTKSSGGAENPEKSSESAPLFTTVDQSYFDDALFIGDSRTVGLSQYSGWKNPVYYADVGLTIYDVFDKKIAEVNGETLTVDKALEKKKFGKIYIMLGINELGRGTTEKFADRYSKVIGRIRELQPDASIFIEGIMRVSKKKSDTDPIFNNNNINDRNAAIEKLADNASVFYIDVNQAIADETGGIPADYTFDNVHLKAAYYHIWTDFLLAHGIIRNP